MRKLGSLFIYLYLFIFLSLTSEAQQLAFPGAEGFGKYSKGGRGGKVIYVENLNDSGSGSLREALESSGPRIVVFKVGGTIKLNSRITIKNPYLTVAGQTAPGDGILIRGNKLSIITHEVILRNIRVRLGDGVRDDAIQIISDYSEVYNVVLDHVSVSWGGDENIGINGVNGGMKNVSIQNCILGEGFMDHSMGILLNKKIDGIGPDLVSIHNNLFISNGGRNPMVGFEIGVTVINNLVHNWTHKGSQYDGRSYGDVLYNRFKVGQDTQAPQRALELTMFQDYPEGSYVYLEGNDLPNGTDGYSGEGKDRASKPYYTVEEYGFTPITEMSQLENHVLTNAGAFPHDAVDTRYINEYKSGTGKTIYTETEAGGFPVLNGGTAPKDSDNDGMPDDWETGMGFNISSDDSAADHDGDGYTNIEEYLNCLIEGGCTNDNATTTPQEPVNTAPSISGISDQIILQDSTTGEIAFTIGDAESSANDLTVNATSDVSAVIDASGIVINGTGGTRTIQIIPNSGALGSATIIIVVSDGSLQSTESFIVTVSSTTTEPVTEADISSMMLINAANNQPIVELTHGLEIPVDKLPTLNLNIQATVSDPDNTGSVVFDWNEVVSFNIENTPPYVLFGTSNDEHLATELSVGTYTVSATSYTESRGMGTAGTPLTVTFKITESSESTNIPPSISAIADQIIALDSSTEKIPFTIADEDNEITDLIVTATSGELLLVDDTGIVLSGTGMDRTIQITPKAGVWGSSLITVKVSDGELESSESFRVSVNPPEEEESKTNSDFSLYLNSGGPSFTFENIKWNADEFFSSPTRSYSTTVNIDGTEKDELYKSERWADTFSYEIPVPSSGKYKVILHFAEVFFNVKRTGGKGSRVFNVSLENGQEGLINYDIFNEAGGSSIAVTETFIVEVIDGNLTIDFASVVDNAKISGIEIHSLSLTSGTAPVIQEISDKNISENSSTNYRITASDAENENITFSIQPSPLSWLTFTDNKDGTADMILKPVAGDEGVYDITITASDIHGNTSQSIFKIEVQSSPDYDLKINTGGGAITFGTENWSADDFFTGGSVYSTNVNIVNSDNDALYRSERYGNMSYAIPVPTAGNYEITLHFAEVYFNVKRAGGTGSRVFNVSLENGAAGLQNYDIFSEAGGSLIAIEETFQVNITDGMLNIDFTNVSNNAKIDGIEIVSLGTESFLSSLNTSTYSEENSVMEVSNEIRLYPNPAENLMTLELSNAGSFVAPLQIYDAGGRLVYVKEYSFTEGHQKINLYLNEILSIAGNYYLIIHSKETESKAVQFIYSK